MNAVFRSELEQKLPRRVSNASSTLEKIMREEQPPPFNVIFDPISKSALIHFGNRVALLSGPFANYREAVAAADRCFGSR